MELLLPSLQASFYRTQNFTFLITAFLMLTLILCLFYLVWEHKASLKNNWFAPYFRFAYACFFKPHATLDDGQQSALEGFYSAQVCL